MSTAARTSAVAPRRKGAAPRTQPAAARAGRPAAPAPKATARRPAVATIAKPARAAAPAPSSPYRERIDRVRADLRTRKLDALLVQGEADQFWLTGFTGEDGAVLLTHTQTILLTDGRFQETAALEAPWARPVIRQKRGPEATASEIHAAKLRRIGFEPAQLSVHAYGGLSKLLKSAKLEPATDLIGPLRMCKDDNEIACILSAVRVAENAFKRVLQLIKVGMREREIAAYLEFVMRDLGADGAAFEPIVAIGPNSALPHYRPGDRRVEPGQVILIDWGARVRGYVSDLTRVVTVGSIPDQLAKAHRVVREAHDKAIAAVKAGVSAGALDRIARAHLKRAGLERQFNHSLGHGIGLQVHEAPGLRKLATEKLRPGMVVTIEPGAYFPGVGGIRLEDDVLVTAKGCEVLSTLPLEFRI